MTTLFAIDADRIAANLEGNTLPRFDFTIDHAVDPFARYAEYRRLDSRAIGPAP